MDPDPPAWYCVRTRQKQEHIAAANLRQLGLEVFNPRLRFRRATSRGPVWFNEALFPSYIFARFQLHPHLNSIRHTTGINTVVHFAGRFPAIPAEIIQDLRAMTGENETIAQDPTIEPGQQIKVAAGPFQGLIGIVQQTLPAADRVRILLEILGRTTEVELESQSVVLADNFAWKRSAAGAS